MKLVNSITDLPSHNHKIVILCIICTPLFLLRVGELSLLANIQKVGRGGLALSHFLEGVAQKEKVTFQGGLQFLHKN